MKKSTQRAYWAVISMVLCLIGCRGGPTIYVHPNADLSIYKKVGVLPLENFTGEQFADERLERVFITELLATGAFEVVEPGEMRRVIREQRISELESINPAEIKKIGNGLGIQGLFMGSVEEYGLTRIGAAEAVQISVTLKLIDVESGLTVWSANHSLGGVSTMNRLFGVGGATTSKATKKLVRILLKSMF